MKRFFPILILLLTLALTGMSQNNVQMGLLPSLNVSKKLPKDWSLHAKAESRQQLYRGDFDYAYLNTDISLIAGRKVSLKTSLAAGYLVRVEPDAVSHRAIQQLTIVNRYSGFRLSHRFSADQTFQRDEATEFRFRYRISSEFALQGQSVDPGEYFFKLNNEYLYSIQGKADDVEIRLGAFVGYSLKPETKIELGIDYRADSFIDSSSRHRLWFAVNFYQNF